MLSCVLYEAGVAICTLGLCIEDLKQDQIKSRSVSVNDVLAATFTIGWQIRIFHLTSRSAKNSE